MSEWRPINTAPFDESVFVYHPIYGRFIAYYERFEDTDFGQWCSWNGDKGFLPPTHWMPLPNPPKDTDRPQIVSERGNWDEQ